MTRSAILAVLLLLMPTAAIQAQNPETMTAVQRASSNAQQLAAAGNWPTARSTMEAALQACNPGPEQSSCRRLSNFTLGYLAQQQASEMSHDNSERSQLLRQADDLYKAVLVDAPNDGATLNNLALLEQMLGENANAAEHWKKAIDVDPVRGGQYALHLGDLLLSQKQVADARAQFSRAADFSPAAETPRRRLVETYRLAPDAELKDLPPFLFQAEALFPSVARSGYELLMSRLYKLQPADSEQALLRWTIVMSQQGWLTQTSLSKLPADWSAPSVAELRRYMADPATANPPWNWWRSRDDRRRVIIEVARTAGKQLLDGEQASAAARCWNVALDSARYIEGNGPPSPPGAPSIGSPVNLRKELALLYYQHPSLDPDSAKLNELVRELFMGKMEAYEHQRWPEIQEYHTVIGLIYAARGVWEPAPGKWPPASAIFQFEHALDAAEHRKRDENFYQPLPEVKARLAQGYEITKRVADAQRMYWLAALAYLDADAPADSTKMLDSYRRMGGASPDARSLEALIHYRSQPVSIASLDEVNAPWLFRVPPSFGQDFLQRQRFKLYADQPGAAESSAASRNERLARAWEAYDLVADKGTPLVGAGDLVRWENVTTTLLEVGHVPPQPLHLLKGAELASSRGRVPRLVLAGQEYPIGISVSPETQSAARIVATVGAANALLLGNYIQLHANQVFVRNEDIPSKIDNLLKNLRDSQAIQISPMAEVPIA